LPRDIGIVYWVCLASPRTSFYVPFHFGIGDFPAGYRLPSQRPTAEAYNRKIQASFTANLQEAFWTFSNFRDKMDREAPSVMERLRTAQRRVEQDAMVMQNPIDEAARRLYPMDKTAAGRLLENYSKGMCLSAMEAMTSALWAK